jgi:penicillin amidase
MLPLVGQPGNLEIPFYNHLFEPWANDQHFPVYYSRRKVDAVDAVGVD